MPSQQGTCDCESERGSCGPCHQRSNAPPPCSTSHPVVSVDILRPPLRLGGTGGTEQHFLCAAPAVAAHFSRSAVYPQAEGTQHMYVLLLLHER